MRKDLSTLANKVFPSDGGTRMIGVTLVREQDHGRILIVKRAPGKPHAGKWCYPGGKAEPNETPIITAARETGEELGRVFSAEGLYPLNLRPEPEQKQLVFTFHNVVDQAFTPDLKLDENVDFAWIQPGELHKFATLPSARDSLKAMDRLRVYLKLFPPRVLSHPGPVLAVQ